MLSHANRTSSLNAMGSRLGHAIVIGGRDQLLRELMSGRFASTFTDPADPDCERAKQMIDKLLRKAPEKSPHKVPTAAEVDRERVKVRWSPEVIARYKKLAPKIKDNIKLAIAMGFPGYCEGSMKRARSRYLPRVVATNPSPKSRPGDSLAAGFAKAA